MQSLSFIMNIPGRAILAQNADILLSRIIIYIRLYIRLQMDTNLFARYAVSVKMA